MNFYCVPQITIERGGLNLLSQWCKGQNTLVISNADGPASRLVSLLNSAGIPAVLFRQRGEPTLANAQAAVRQCRDEQSQLVVGIGGGSAIDLAKATAAITANGGEALDYMEGIGRGQPLSKQPLPWIAIPTTAGAGAETTRNAVITDHERQCKASIRSERLLAQRVLIDAELALDVRPAVTAASGCDALCQAIESYTSTGANPLTDGLALQAIRLAVTSLPRVYDNGRDIDARESMAVAALLSGITLSNAGLGAVHGFAAPIGGNFPAPHGVVCAALLPPVMEANIRCLRQVTSPLLARYVDVCRILIADPVASADLALSSGVEWLSSLVKRLQIPRLGAFGLTEAAIAAMVELAQKAGSMRYNPVKLSPEGLTAILRKAL